MTKEQALDILHAELPPEANFTLFQDERTTCDVRWERGKAYRAHPPQYKTAFSWSVTVSAPPAWPAAYMDVTMEDSLETCVSEALRKFREWLATCETAKSGGNAKPPRQTAPGAAERELEERFRKESQQFRWEAS